MCIRDRLSPFLSPSAGAVFCYGLNDAGQAEEPEGIFGTYVPETTLTSTPPPVTNDSNPSFSFISPDPAATFECSLDVDYWFVPCTSPKVYTDVPPGTHRFMVRAISVEGARSNPESFEWDIGTIGPIFVTLSGRAPESGISLLVDPGTYSFVATWGSAGSANGQLQQPHDLALDGAGHVFVTDTANDRLQKFDLYGLSLIHI